MHRLIRRGVRGHPKFFRKPYAGDMSMSSDTTTIARAGWLPSRTSVASRAICRAHKTSTSFSSVTPSRSTSRPARICPRWSFSICAARSRLNETLLTQFWGLTAASKIDRYTEVRVHQGHAVAAKCPFDARHIGMSRPTEDVPRLSSQVSAVDHDGYRDKAPLGRPRDHAVSSASAEGARFLPHARGLPRPRPDGKQSA